jgi:hypothetical protein
MTTRSPACRLKTAFASRAQKATDFLIHKTQRGMLPHTHRAMTNASVDLDTETCSHSASHQTGPLFAHSMLGHARRGSLLSTVKPLSETLATTTAAGANGGGIVDAALVVVNSQMYPQTATFNCATGCNTGNLHAQQPLQQHAVRRASMNVKLEYAIAMINQDAKLDSDDRFMSPFGTRRDSVCGNSNSSKHPLRRHVKRSAESA